MKMWKTKRPCLMVVLLMCVAPVCHGQIAPTDADAGDTTNDGILRDWGLYFDVDDLVGIAEENDDYAWRIRRVPFPDWAGDFVGGVGTTIDAAGVIHAARNDDPFGAIEGGAFLVIDSAWEVLFRGHPAAGIASYITRELVYETAEVMTRFGVGQAVRGLYDEYVRGIDLDSLSQESAAAVEAARELRRVGKENKMFYDLHQLRLEQLRMHGPDWERDFYERMENDYGSDWPLHSYLRPFVQREWQLAKQRYLLALAQEPSFTNTVAGSRIGRRSISLEVGDFVGRWVVDLDTSRARLDSRISHGVVKNALIDGMMLVAIEAVKDEIVRLGEYEFEELSEKHPILSGTLASASRAPVAQLPALYRKVEFGQLEPRLSIQEHQDYLGRELAEGLPAYRQLLEFDPRVNAGLEGTVRDTRDGLLQAFAQQYGEIVLEVHSGGDCELYFGGVNATNPGGVDAYFGALEQRGSSFIIQLHAPPEGFQAWVLLATPDVLELDFVLTDDAAGPMTDVTQLGFSEIAMRRSR